MEISENTSINEYAIELVEKKQLLYRLIYTFSLVELETLKTYIENHLKTGFIWLSKSLASASIFFNKNPGSNFYLCMDYQSLNNLIIKNWYFFPLIGKALDCLSRVKRFI